MITQATSVLDNAMRSDVPGDNHPVDQEVRASAIKAGAMELHALVSPYICRYATLKVKHRKEPEPPIHHPN